MSRTRSYLVSLLVMSAVALVAAPAYAATLAYDGFDYTQGLNAWNGAGGTETGFSGTWATDDAWHKSGVQTGNGVSNIVGGLTFGTYSVSGNAVQLIANRASPNELLPVGGRAVSFNSGSDYYTSYLFNLTSASEGTTNCEMFVGATQLAGSSNDTDTRFIAGTDKFATYLPGSSIFFTPVAAVGTTYMYVSKIAYDGTDTTATSWILDAADYNTVAADGMVDEAELAANCYATGSVQQVGAFGITSGQYLHFETYAGGGLQRTSVMDEMRVATTLGEVTGIVPEPATSTLVLMGLAGLLCYAWRKRK
ncbi:MAG: PEP-CTERM sorting domain-containing protein [Pirellulales bacterium]|nr:PEP-CTERM sorting domain-containing protein [Pirellulales bacterium]